MISRRDWWIGIVLVVLTILVHALVPRYEYQQAGPGSIAWVRVDRWPGQALATTWSSNLYKYQRKTGIEKGLECYKGHYHTLLKPY